MAIDFKCNEYVSRSLISEYNNKKTLPQFKIMKKIINFVLSFFSGEWILHLMEFNGGNVIFLRAFWVTAYSFVAVTMIKFSINDNLICAAYFSTHTTLDNYHVEWFGAIFGGAYATFYARFSSQWSYLAGVYNQIKEAEVNGVKCSQALAEWKAGFMEDAMHLHLATKMSIAPIINAWSKDEVVKAAFIESVPKGEIRWHSLMYLIKKAIAADS